MVIRMDDTPPTLTVWLSGELDHHAARPLREQVDAAIARSSSTVLRLDFAGVTFMDSSGIGVIIGRHKMMQFRKGKLSVMHLGDRVETIFRAAGLQKIVEVKENEEC